MGHRVQVVGFRILFLSDFGCRPEGVGFGVGGSRPLSQCTNASRTWVLLRRHEDDQQDGWSLTETPTANPKP